MNALQETPLQIMLRALGCKALALLHDRKANVAMMFGLSLVPIMLATGAGLDFARGMKVHQRMGEALDAAALAVGSATTKPGSCPGATTADKKACADLQATAQQYFDVNYDHAQDSNYGKPEPVALAISNQAVTLSSNLALKLTLLGIDVLNVGEPRVSASSTVVWGQTRMWVALVLDNSGSMDKGDNGGTKMAALKDAITNSSYGVLKTFQNASATAGDIKVGIVPFTRSVNMGYSGFASSGSIEWGEWEAPPAAPGTDLRYDIDNPYDSSPATISFEAWGPGDECPFTTSSGGGWGGPTISRKAPFGFTCTSAPANSASTIANIPDSGSYKGYICPGIDSGDSNSDHRDRYYNGCWTSTKSNNSKVRVSKGSSANCGGFSSNNCTCNGNGNGRHCDTQKWTHVWVPNVHSSWSGCVTDRQQKNRQTRLATGNGLRMVAASDYDESNTQPSAGSAWDDTKFPAENPASCPDATVSSLGNDWSSLSSKVSNMQPDGSTNQAIGVAHGFQMLTTGAPMAPARCLRVLRAP